MENLAELVEANEELAAAIASAYEILVGGVPNVEGFEFLIENALETNFGAGDGVEFNRENIFINIANSLVQGNPDAQANFELIIAGAATLSDKVVAIYNALVPPGAQPEGALEWLTRPEALEFYAAVAAERGVEGPNGAAIVAMASILNEAVKDDVSGIGDATNDLIAAILNGSAVLPATGDTFTPIEVADGTDFDTDDNNGGKAVSLTDRIDAPGIDESQPGSGRDTTGTGLNDRYIASDETLNPGDEIAAGGGSEDILEFNVSANSTFGVSIPALAALGEVVLDLPEYEIDSSGLEIVEVQLTGSPAIIADILSGGNLTGAGIDLLRSDDVEHLVVDQSGGAVSFRNVQQLVDLSIARSNGIFSVEFDNGALGGEAAFDLEINDVLGMLQLQANGGDTINALNIAAAGDNILLVSDVGDPSLALQSLTVAGDGTVILVQDWVSALLSGGANMPTEFAGLTSIDFSDNTGGVAIDLLTNVEDLVFTGGSGSDIALFASDAGGGFVTNDDSLDGGLGYDVLGFGGDDLVALDPETVQNFELFALFNDASGAEYEFEGSEFSAELALFADWNNTLRLDDYDGREVFAFGDLNGTTLQWDDTDVAAITVGLPAELNAYVDLIVNSLDNVGADPFVQILNTLPLTTFIGNVDLTGQDTATELLLTVAPEDGLLPFPGSFLDIDVVTLDATSSLETITVVGTGNVDIDEFSAAFLDGVTFDLTAHSGLFDNSAATAANFAGSQAYIFGSGDGDVVFGPAASDDAQDVAVFTEDFGVVEINGFAAWAAENNQGEQDLLDFTQLGVTQLSQLDLAVVGGNVNITSDLFDGTVILVGVAATTDVALENFAGLTA